MQFSILTAVLFIASISIIQSKSVNIPECIQKKINEISSEPVWNSPARINRYIYNGQTTYLFSSNCCDQFDNLYDESCNHICSPSGGFTGRGDLKCTDFNQQAKFLGQAWVDSRSQKA